jgi:hypothetical protein
MKILSKYERIVVRRRIHACHMRRRIHASTEDCRNYDEISHGQQQQKPCK